MARVPIDPVVGAIAPRPTAGPAPVFVGTSAGASTAQLAQAFAGLAPSLTRFTQQVAEEEQRDETAAGEEAARRLEESRLEYGEAIRRGIIEPNDSPWFRFGLKKQMGVTAALRYQRELTAAAQELPEDASLEDFEKFEREWFTEWQKANIGDNRDDAFAQGFANSAAQAKQGVALAFANRANQASLKLFEEQLQTRIGTVLSGITQSAVAGDYATAAKSVEGIVSEAIQLNPRLRGRATELIANALYAEALARKDEDVFTEVASRLRGGTGRFDQITSVKQMQTRLVDEIINREERQRIREEAQEKERKQTALNSALAGFTAEARTATRWDLVDPEPFAVQLEEQGLAAEANQLRQFAKSRLDLRFETTSQGVFKPLIGRVFRGEVDEAGIMGYMGRLTPEQFSSLLSLADQKRRMARGDSVTARGFDNPVFTAMMRNVRDAIQPAIQGGNLEASQVELNITGELITRYQRFLEQYEREGRDPSFGEVTEFVNTNYNQTIAANAGSFRRMFESVAQSIGGGSAGVRIGKTAMQYGELSDDVRRDISLALGTGRPLSINQRMTLEALFPDLAPAQWPDAWVRADRTAAAAAAAKADSLNNSSKP